MYFYWFLAAIGVLGIWIAIKRFYLRSDKRMLSPFQQTRPIPDLSSPPDLEVREKVRSGLLNLANAPDDSFKSSLAHDVGKSQNVGQPHIVGSQTQPMDSQWLSAPVASVGTTGAGGAGQGENRLSTWGDRRLFSEFRGILSEDIDRLGQIVPDELPIRDKDLLFGQITPAVAQLLPESATRRETQRKNLTGAGYFSRASWMNLAALRFVLGFAAVVIIGILLIFAPPVAEPWLVVSLVIAPLMAWAVPPLVVAFKASERRIDIDRGLPDVLDMMNMGVSQGLTVPQSLKRISREITTVHPALAEELQLLNQQAEVGSMPQALRNFSQRIDSPDVNSFTSLLIQSETTGTSISRSLTEYSDGIRSSLKERADSRANLASFQLLFPVALLLMPSVFLFLLGPAIVQFSDFYNNQAQTLQQNRRDAIQTLDQSPQAFPGRFNRPIN